MKLETVRVQNYKSVEDSTEFSIASLTCLAGKNESGKTAVLQALRRLNPVESAEAAFDATMEYPRRRLYDAQEPGKLDVLTTTWTLSDDDVQEIEQRVGPSALASRIATLKKGYDGKRNWSVPLHYKAVITGLISKSPDLTEAAAAQRLPTAAPNDASDLVVREVEAHFRVLPTQIEYFDHYAPSAYLLEHWPSIRESMPGVDEALDRFEALFTKLNALLA